LTARVLEEAGIASVIVGSAFDIVTSCGVPRYLYVDFPLGNPLGKPWDHDMQLDTVRNALALVNNADEPVVVESELTWDTNEDWKQNFMKIDDSNREQLKRMGEENRRRRRELKEKGLRRE
jgi:hypothetical protein